MTPPSVIVNVASDKARQGESTILAIRSSPEPLRRLMRVCTACQGQATAARVGSEMPSYAARGETEYHAIPYHQLLTHADRWAYGRTYLHTATTGFICIPMIPQAREPGT